MYNSSMMKDISNQVFGRLTAIEPTGEKRWRVYMWRCRCVCGKEVVAAVNSLCSGTVRSCGCLRLELAAKHQLKHGRCGTPEYISWDSMIQRCTNPKNTQYSAYGAVGVTVAPEWLDFAGFFASMGPRPLGTTLDRKDSFGNYEPGNCRWATSYEQNHNKRKPITTFEQAEEVRARYAAGEMPTSIAKAVGITRGSVSGIVYLGQISKPA